MATRSATAGVRHAARKVAAPFWKAVETSGLDRFFVERMLRALLRRFRADRFAKITQGGFHGDARAELTRVFIDLDATSSSSPPSKRGRGEAERIVASWTNLANESREAQGQRVLPGFEGDMSVPLEVVLGGPGQGKSTVGRFLVLIHASLLLLTSPVDGIATPAETAQMEALLEGLSSEDIALPGFLRLPLWIDLRDLAGALLQDREADQDPLAGMLRWFATNDLREPADVASLEKALSTLPWLIVFDGFDEVPPERGRALISHCIAGVRNRFARGQGRVIATSRPQSYDPEAFGGGPVERDLLPLEKERASLYAERFITSLYPEDDDQRAPLLAGTRKALEDPRTAVLMSNPLLVTIMATIVMHHGEPSNRRWTLFEQYYGTLYRRETLRGTYASATLKEQEPVIAAIHRHVGMSLHVRCEGAEGASALMPEHELRGIIREHLIADHDEDEASRLTDEILRATEQRLVLLVQSQEGMFGFELRSFQEFMAAWQIVSLTEAHTDALLRRLGPLHAWRNVVLFVIGQQYATKSNFERNRSIGLCATLNRAAELDCAAAGSRIGLPGARLALDVLGDAPYATASKPRDELVSRALELLHLPPADIHQRLARRLWGIASAQLIEAIEDALRDPVRAETGWITLLAGPNRKDMTDVADHHWPAEYGGRRAIVRAYSHWVLQNPRPWGSAGQDWLASRVREDLSLALPGDLLALGLWTGGATYVALRPVGVGWAIGSTGAPAGQTTDQLQIPTTPPWAIERAAKSFRQDTSARGLATALEDLAGTWQERSSWYWPPFVAWPLLGCLMASENAGELRAVIERLGRGELGDGPRWREVEANGPSFDLHDLEAVAMSPDPLRTMFVEGRMLPVDPTRGSVTTHPSASPLRRSFLRKLDAIGSKARAPWVRRMIEQIVLALPARKPIRIEPGTANQWASADRLVDLINTTGSAFNVGALTALSPDAAASEIGAVIERTTAPIISSGPRGTSMKLLSFVEPLAVALCATPGSLRLQQALVAILQLGAQHQQSPALMAEARGDGREAMLLRFVGGHATVEDAPALARRLATMNDAWELRSSLRMLAAHAPSRDLVLPVVEALLALPEVDSSLRSAAVEFVADQIANAPSGLASPESWKAAGLPAPPPMPHRSEPPELRSSPVTLVEINNLRAFPQRFEVPVPASAGPGQWMVFLGENATGKTTLLRAIAMALASPADAAAVPSNLEGPLRRDAARDGLVRVRLADGRELTTTITGPAGEERVVVAPEQPTRPWVVGYGCRRGSAISGTDMDNAFAPFRDLENLFDRSRGVLRASGWLKELQRLAKNNGSRSKMVFEAAREALRKVLLGAENVRVEAEVLVDFEDGRQVPLALLSDGYLTTAGWIVDLMARWLKRNEGRRAIDDKFCSVMEGVVLLDEIDLHLHPRWQERVIEDVRTLFPRMTFIATTHHPLTLRGAREGEVFILGDHDGSGGITALQLDIPAGTRVDELLTGEWFNRPSAIVDNETRALLDEHQQLVLGGAKAGEPRRKALEKELRKRLGRYADTSLERLAATIVARHLDGSLPEPSAQKREEVRAKVAEILRRRDAKRG